MTALQVSVYANAPLFIKANPDDFGRVFALMDDADQVEVLMAMIKHMKPHQTQWDHIAIALEKHPEFHAAKSIFQNLAGDTA